jgi:hypothetical protein
MNIMNKIWIALAAAAAGVIIPLAAQARDEGAWDTTRAQVQSTTRNDTVQVGRGEQWDSTATNVLAAESNAVSNKRLSDNEQWDSTRRAQQQPQQQRTSGHQEAGNGNALICACQPSDEPRA